MQAAALAEVRSVAEHSGSVDVADLLVSTDSSHHSIAHHTLPAPWGDRVRRFAASPIDACTRADDTNKRADEATR